MASKEKQKAYSNLLKTKNWLNKRNLILLRDKHKCRECKSDEKLHVHHKIYINGRNPWEVPAKFLITLCEYCHNKVHEGKEISSFFKNETPLLTKMIEYEILRLANPKAPSPKTLRRLDAKKKSEMNEKRRQKLDLVKRQLEKKTWISKYARGLATKEDLAKVGIVLKYKLNNIKK